MAIKKKGTAVVAWQEQMSAAAKQQAAVEQVTGSFKSISTRNGILSVDDNAIKDNELRCIILASAHENQHYQGAFNPSQLNAPACFALSLDGADMAPHENSQDIQNETCDGCWANEMGSAETGRGKACKNIRRLLLVTEDALDSAEAMEEAEARMLKVPVTSVNNWSKFVNRIAEEMDRPSWGVVALIKLVPDAKTQFKLQFSFESLVSFDQELFDATLKRIEDLNKEIIAPYAIPSEEDTPAPAKRGKPAPAPARGKPAPARGKGVSKPAPARSPGGKRGKF